MNFDYIKIDPYSATPMYIQLSNAIISAMELGHLKQNDILPSINDVSAELEISRDTAEKGYKRLKGMNVLGSVPGKGYFIRASNYKPRLKIFLLFNKLSAHKKIMYDAFIASLDEDVLVDFYIYNNDFKLFKKLLSEKKDDYTHYVIIPHFIEGEDLVPELINHLPPEKVILLDKKLPFLKNKCAVVYENFENDIYGALEKALERLSKYDTIKIIFPKQSYYPKEIITGFKKFCQQYAFRYEVINDLEREKLSIGAVYISVMETDLVTLIEKASEQGVTIGKELGIISYNETPLKRIILKGITTISTDFKQMGILTAGLISSNQIKEVEVPFSIVLRDSL